jgi:DNA-binding XRE family transcriptional regulator
MLALPQSTEFNKKIPKQKFYENLTVSPALKRVFIEQIRAIYWRNKIAPTTVNVSAGEEVTELEVFEIQLNQSTLDEIVLRQIDKEIPYHILFVLTYEDKVQAWIGFKEAAASGTNAFKVNRYFHTDWLQVEELSLQITGLNMDTVYEGFVRQIAGDVLQDIPTATLKDSVEKAEQKAALEKQISALQAKIRKEKQLNRQVEMNTEMKRLRKELEGLR